MERLTLEVSLDEDVAEALPQFLKRVSFKEWRECAETDEEAYRMAELLPLVWVEEEYLR
jgi:hypothetical protein